jgi:hypothetical protein
MIENAPQPPPVDVDALLRQTQPGLIVSAAAILAAGTGVFLLITAFQLWDLVVFRGAFKAIPAALGAAGVVSLPLALKIFRLRLWAVVGGLIFFGVAALGTALWFFVSTLSGMFSAAGALAWMLAIGAAVTAGLAISPCQRAVVARRQLAAAGLDITI